MIASRDAPPPSLKAITVRTDIGTVAFKKDSQTSPSRPSTLQVLSPTTSAPSSQPIPVPSQVRPSPKQQPISPSSPQNVKRVQTSPAELAAVNIICIFLIKTNKVKKRTLFNKTRQYNIENFAQIIFQVYLSQITLYFLDLKLL